MRSARSTRSAKPRIELAPRAKRSRGAKAIEAAEAAGPASRRLASTSALIALPSGRNLRGRPGSGESRTVHGVGARAAVEVPSAAVDGIEPPFSGDAFELVGATVTECDARAGHEILHRLRNEDFTRARVGGHASAGGDGNPGYLPIEQFTFAGVDACAHLETERLKGIADCVRAADRACRTVKGGEEAVPGGVVLDAAKSDGFQGAHARRGRRARRPGRSTRRCL